MQQIADQKQREFQFFKRQQEDETRKKHEEEERKRREQEAVKRQDEDRRRRAQEEARRQKERELEGELNVRYIVCIALLILPTTDLELCYKKLKWHYY